MTEPSQIVVAAHSPLPYRTAAEALGQALSLPVIGHDQPQAHAIHLGPPAFMSTLDGPDQLLQTAPRGEPWDLLYRLDDGGWLVTGSAPLAAAHAALQLLDWLQEKRLFPQPYRKIRTRQFRSMELEFDDWTGGFNRLADGFDIEQHAQDIVRIGGTSLEVNMLDRKSVV